MSFLLTCFSIIELLFFKSAASTYLQSSLSFFFVAPGNKLSLTVFLLACLISVCDRCTRSATCLTLCDRVKCYIDSVTPLCRRESPSVVQGSTATLASVMLQPISRPLWHSDKLSYLLMFAVHPTCPPGQMAVLSPFLLNRVPFKHILFLVKADTV